MNHDKHIILVDDDLSIQDAVRTVLTRAGYRITTYVSGQPLLNNEFESPDLFILDKLLPGIDGLEVCRYLKSQQTMQHIPVLILSASPQAGPLARDACADEFLEKPFTIKALREAVARLMRTDSER